jgi:hypothetical protein
MARRSKADPFEKWYALFFFLIVGGVLAWDLLPHWAIYAVGGILVLSVAVGVALRIRGSRTFADPVVPPRPSAPAPTPKLPPLRGDELGILKDAVGRRCESLQCRNPNALMFEVHHIIERGEPGATNTLDNLIVLCRECHALAQRGIWTKTELRRWARRENRFVYPDLVWDWDDRHRWIP